MNRKKNLKNDKKKSHRSHKTSQKKKGNDSSEDEESVDLTEQLYPIAHFIDNRPEMINQVFSVMEKEKLNCMLPPVLKGFPISVLKEKCLKELINMSEQEVYNVLRGEPTPASDIKPPETVVGQLESESSSSDSISSVEECTNEEQEKKTLLDILEQEMQAIAYQTVKNTEESSEDLPEIIQIIPAQPAVPKTCVPLVCLDSEDENEVACAVVPQLPSESDELCDSGIRDSTNTSITSAMDKNFSTPCNDISPISRDDKVVSKCGNPVKISDELHHESTEPLEAIQIQVFANKSFSSGRVVKKICQTPCNEINSGNKLSSDVSQHPVDCSCLRCERKRSECAVLKNTDTQDEPILQVGSTCKNKEELPSNKILDVPKHLCSGPDPSMTPSSETCDITSAFKPLIAMNEDDPLAHSAQSQEKEEGEITGEESEEDIQVLEAVEDCHRSSTIFLSSDCSDKASDSERHESRLKHHKHHRHKRTKRSADSPERSKRRIEKRGTRSYRCKTTKVTNENLKCDERDTSEKCSDLVSIEIERSEASEKDASFGDKETPLDKKLSESCELPVEEQKEMAIALDIELPESPKLSEEEKRGRDMADDSNNTEEKSLGNRQVSSDEAEELVEVEALSSKTSWADRWAVKKDLKKVVITSKICRNVRKRILSAKKKKKEEETCCVQSVPLPPVPPLVLHVEGSVQEYQMLQLLDPIVFNESPDSMIVDKKKSDDLVHTNEVHNMNSENTEESSNVLPEQRISKTAYSEA